MAENVTNGHKDNKRTDLPQLIFTVGLPASGKTTWAKQVCQDDENWVRVNRDDLRRMRGKYWIPEQEKLITEWEIMTVASALMSGKNVIVDATNLYADRRERMIKQILGFTRVVGFGDFFFKYDIKDFTSVTPEVCIERDRNRMDASESVGSKVILDMARKANLLVTPEPPKFINGAPTCIIVDIDGTLAINDGHRKFYEWDKVYDDKVNQTIAQMVRDYADHYKSNRIIIVSGRKGVCMSETAEWLKDNHIPFHRIFMRKADDNRKDSIVKQEIYEEHIKGNYNVDYVLDDRNQTVAMWRAQGLQCLQVAEGNF